MKFSIIFIILFISVNSLAICEAIKIKYLSPEEMSQKSNLTVFVEIKEIKNILINDRVYTDAICEIKDVWRGKFEKNIVTIRQCGGTLENKMTWAGPIPTWKVGEEWVFNLSEAKKDWWTIYGIKQGAFKNVNGVAEREFSGFSFMIPPPKNIIDNKEILPLSVLKEKMTKVNIIPEKKSISNQKIIKKELKKKQPDSIIKKDDIKKTDIKEEKYTKSNSYYILQFALCFIGFIVCLVLIIKKNKK